MTRRIAPLLPLALALACGGGRKLDTAACEDRFTDAVAATCAVPAWDDRDYDVVLPDGYDGSSPVPVVVAFHGGGGNRSGAARTTCPTGDVREAACLHELGRREGFAVVYPDGVPGKGLLIESRTWNAGGGVGTWRCTSGRACEEGHDDVAYVRALLDDLEGRVAVDPERIYATGLSNGGAISHRLGCEASDRFAAIAPIGGAMQLTTSDVCEPTRPVPVLHIHGTDDPCWVYDGGESECPVGQRGLEHVSVQRTLDEWSAINGCSEADPVEESLPNREDDGSTTVHQIWQDCDAPTEHLRVDGGGHTWPNGHQYLGEKVVGPAWRDWGNEVLWDFFEAHPMAQPTTAE